MKSPKAKRYSLKKYIFRIFTPIALMISLIISILLSWSDYKSNLDFRQKSQKIILSTFLVSIRQPLIQGSLIEAQIRSDELVSHNQVDCVEIKISSEVVKSCKKEINHQRFLEKLESDLTFSESSSQVLAHVTITFNNADMMWQLWKSLAKNVIGFVLLSALLFVGFLFGSQRIKFELIELLKLSESSENIKLNDDTFKIKEIHSVSEKLLKQMDITKKEARAAAALKTARQVSHDLKSPLVSLQMAVNIAQNQLDDKTKNVINQSAQRITDIAQDIVKKYEPIKLSENSLNKTNVTEVLNDIFIEKKYLCGETKELRLNLEKLNKNVYIEVNASDLKRALSNIIDNAIQAISGLGVIKLEAHVSDKKCCISVSDTGQGIHNSVLDQIIRSGGTFSKPNGKGLGLSWVREIMQKNHGKMLIKSRVNVGTTVSLILPVNQKVEKINQPHLRLLPNEV